MRIIVLVMHDSLIFFFESVEITITWYPIYDNQIGIQFLRRNFPLTNGPTLKLLTLYRKQMNSTQLLIYNFLYTHTYTHTHTHTHIYIRLCGCVCVCVCVFISRYTHVDKVIFPKVIGIEMKSETSIVAGRIM